MFDLEAMMADEENTLLEPPHGGEFGLGGTLVWTLRSTLGGETRGVCGYIALFEGMRSGHI